MSERNHYRTYRELCESIRTSLDPQGYPPQATRHSLLSIYESVLDMRTSYLKRTKVAHQGIGQENIQTISCVALEEADQNICPCRPPTGCTWLKTTKSIPKSIFPPYVTNTNAAFKADYVEWSQFKTKTHSRSRRENSRYYTLLDTGEGPFIYLYNDQLLESLSLTGLWEDPNHAAYYTSCKKETDRQAFLRCNPLDTPLYMDRDIVDIVFKMTYDFFSRTGNPAELDIKGDSMLNYGQIQNPTV